MNYTAMAEVAQRRVARHIARVAQEHSDAINKAHLLALQGFLVDGVRQDFRQSLDNYYSFLQQNANSHVTPAKGVSLDGLCAFLGVRRKRWLWIFRESDKALRKRVGAALSVHQHVGHYGGSHTGAPR